MPNDPDDNITAYRINELTKRWDAFEKRFDAFVVNIEHERRQDNTKGIDTALRMDRLEQRSALVGRAFWIIFATAAAGFIKAFFFGG